MKRKQTQKIVDDLKKKMVFIVGPRQSGKTWIAKEVAKYFSKPIYLSYDHAESKYIIENESWDDSLDLIIFDELHKMPNWRNYIKGVFDTKRSWQSILVTSSARLDILKQTGDSLAGRVFTHHLFPLSPAELFSQNIKYHLDSLLERSGFPEPYLADSEIDAQKWRREYINNILNIDVFDFENIQLMKNFRLVFDILRRRVGYPISYQSISRDVGVSHNTVKKYIYVLEALYVIFKITPYSKKIARSILKEPKIYFFDNGLVSTNNDGAKLENLVANSLYKHVVCKSDYLGEELSLCYLKTKDGKEVDFALVNDGEIISALEVKTSDKVPSKALLWFYNRFGIEAIQLVKNLKIQYKKDNATLIPVDEYLKVLFC